MADSIHDRFVLVNERIEKACQQVGRPRQDVNLIVVTKGHPASSILEVINSGATLLGENYPEETIRKIDELGNQLKPTWHMIGHLQSRKIKLMFPSFACIHSIDSMELAKKVNRFYEEMNSTIDVLIEVNIAGEDSKFGFDANTQPKRDELLGMIGELSNLPHLHLLGLMTMPPYAEEPTQNEACYNLCYDYCQSISQHIGLKDFKQLSMGTSADFETAIKSGATYVRVGESIMGKRIYPNKL